MKVGQEYLYSPEKRALDRAVLRFTYPLFGVIQFGNDFAYDMGSDRPTIIAVKRVGQFGKSFDLFKFNFRNPAGEFNRLGEFLARKGLDELAQVKNIKSGELSVSGRRPIASFDLEKAYDEAGGKIVDEYKELVLPTKPGIVSTFANSVHKGVITGSETNGIVRLSMDIEDVRKASLLRDVKLILGATSLS